MNPRVAHIVNQYLPITENWVYNQIRSLPSLESIVLTHRSVINRDAFPLTKVFSFADQNAATRLYQRVLKKLTGREMLPYFARLCRQQRVGILHAHFGFMGAHFLPLKRELSLPLVTTFYGYDLRQIFDSEPILRELYPQLFELGDRFLVEGPAMAKTLNEIGCPEEKIHVQRLGVSPDSLPKSEVVGQTSGTIHILMAASFREKKGHRDAISAFAQIPSQFPDVVLDLIGDGPLRPAMQQLTESLGIAKHVRFHGQKNRSDLNDFIRQTHLFLHPSITTPDGDTEGGSPVIITETAAAGIPVVSTYHADIPEAVIHEETGLLAAEGDVETLTSHLVTLIKDSKRRSTMGQRAQAHIKTRFSLATQGESLESQYLTLL